MKAFSRLLFTGTVVALIMTSGFVYAQTIRIATEGAYPPFNYTEASGELGGFDVDIAKALCAEMKVTCDIVAQDWDGILPGLIAKKYDAVIASVSITEERRKTVDFTDKYYSNHLRFIAKKGTDVSPSALRGKSLGAQRATLAAQYLEDNFGSRSRIKLYDTQTAAYGDLTSGRLTAILSDVYPAYDWVSNNPKFALVGNRVDLDDNIGIAVRKGEDDLRDAFNRALKAIRNNGEYAKINKKYFPFDIY